MALKDTVLEHNDMVQMLDHDTVLANLKALVPIKPKRVRIERIKKLHILLKIALEDFEKVLAQPDKFSIDMSEWYVTAARGKCNVCLAGSVLACRTQYQPDGRYEWSTSPISKQMHALDSLRQGKIAEAYGYIHGWHTPIPVPHRGVLLEWVNRIPYRARDARGLRDATRLLKYLREMHKDLEKANL